MKRTPHHATAATNTAASWTIHLTARSSIAHGGETRGTIGLLRRELVITPDGSALQIPIISGNSLRGRLRRIGEELIRDELGYAGHIPAAAAHALRGGGALTKTSAEPLSGSRLAQLRTLVPLIGIFGTAASGCIVDGALSVGKVVPHVRETAHITGIASTTSAFEAVQLETYTRLDDNDRHDFTAVVEPGRDVEARSTDRSRQMMFQVETFPVGTPFSTWAQLRRPSDLELSFFGEILQVYSQHGTLGGRSAIGHGQVDVSVHLERGAQPDLGLWRQQLDQHRDEVLEAIGHLT